MPENADVIKEYLVSLGWAVDERGRSKADQAVEGLGKKIEKFTAKFATAGKAVGVFGVAILGVTASVTKMMDGLGNQEIQMEMLSRQLWTTQKTAQAFSLTLQAMHANIQQLYLSPTLMAQYHQLFSVAQKLSPNTNAYDAQIRKVQALSLQFKQLRLEMSYGRQWFGMAFIKDMAGPIGNLNKKLQELNDTIIKHLPGWTQKIASVASGFFGSFSLIGNAVASVYHGLQNLGNYLPAWVKVVAGSFAAIAVIMASNPFFLAIEGITAFLLLLDDYYVWSKGGKAEFGGLWKSLTNGINKFKQAMQATGADKSLQTMFSTLKSDLDGIQGDLNSFGSNASLKTNLTALATILKGMADSANVVLKLIGMAMNPKTVNGPGLGFNKNVHQAGSETYQWAHQHGVGGLYDFISGRDAWTRSGLSPYGDHAPIVMSPNAQFQSYMHGQNLTPNHVTINQSNNFTGTGSGSDTLNNLNQANSNLIRQFKSGIQ